MKIILFSLGAPYYLCTLNNFQLGLPFNFISWSVPLELLVVQVMVLLTFRTTIVILYFYKFIKHTTQNEYNERILSLQLFICRGKFNFLMNNNIY